MKIVNKINAKIVNVHIAFTILDQVGVTNVVNATVLLLVY